MRTTILFILGSNFPIRLIFKRNSHIEWNEQRIIGMFQDDYTFCESFSRCLSLTQTVESFQSGCLLMLLLLSTSFRLFPLSLCHRSPFEVRVCMCHWHNLDAMHKIRWKYSIFDVVIYTSCAL